MRTLAIAVLAASLMLVGGCRKRAVEAGAPLAENANAATKIETAARLLGVPLYPGATPHKTQVAYVEKDEAGGKRYYMLFETADPAERVVTFYRDALAAKESNIGGAIQLAGNASRGAPVTVSVGTNGRSSATAFTITAFQANTGNAALAASSYGYGGQSLGRAESASPPPANYSYPNNGDPINDRDVEMDYMDLLGPEDGSQQGTSEQPADASYEEAPPEGDEPVSDPPPFEDMPPEPEPIEAPPDEEPAPDDLPPGEDPSH